MITIEKLKERKTTIEADIKKVDETLVQLESQRASLQANLFALQGANQQIDFFIAECEVETSEDKEDG
jgi:prefoldin subunit 5